MTYDLTKQQEKILNYIRNEVNTKGYPPSVREICTAVGLKSTSTVHGHLAKLEKNGYIRRDPTKPRAIEILDCDDPLFNKKEVIDVPVIGKVTAGLPILAVENIEDSFPVPLDFVSDNSKYFMLSVKGNSMINAGILNEDYVLVKQQQVADNGEIVVAMIDDEATVKRFYKEKNHIRLQPENPSMDPIITSNVRVLGIVKGVFRKL